MTEKGVLPDGWMWVRFGDVVRQVKETTKDPEIDGLSRIVGLEHLDSESLPLRRWHELDDLPDGTSFTRTFRAGQVLFGKRRAYQRKVAVPAFDGVCSGDILVFEPATDELVSEFLPFMVQSDGFSDHALGTSAGSLSPRTKWQELAKYKFGLPPLDLQREICEVLSAGQRQVDALEHALGAARGLRDAIVLRESDAVDHVPLGTILSSCDYGLSVAPQDAGELPILRMNNLDSEELRLDDMKWVQHDQVSESDLLQTGDILFNRTNSLEHVGKVALVDGLDNPATFASYLLRLRVDRESMLPEFVAAYLQSAGGQRRIRAFITQGVSQANVNATNLKKVRIPKPDLDAQRLIVDCWQGVRDLQRAIEDHCRESRSVLAAVREGLLAGDNRVR
ncbi:restriction endonuclease subunit S [Candidatus Poriferisodalis sp.]|uniref:restriction endonuclease subunit S n=1 Tax=Candidatus Poriferisodalis sp. TaxID=3101277 RepID=UPI003B58F2CC